MRMTIVAAICALMPATQAYCQEQDRKLMDRLLKPDTTVQNNAQNKYFVASGSTTTTRTVPMKPFNFINRIFPRSFGGVRTIKPQEFHTTTSRHQRAEANLYTRNSAPRTPAYRTSEYSATSAAADGEKKVSTATYSDEQRAFLVRGKSQKSLSAHDRPLTIEEVRELLNKNK